MNTAMEDIFSKIFPDLFATESLRAPIREMTAAVCALPLWFCPHLAFVDALFDAQYPGYLEKNKDKIPPEDFARYTKQHECYQVRAFLCSFSLSESSIGLDCNRSCARPSIVKTRLQSVNTCKRSVSCAALRTCLVESARILLCR